MESGTVKAMSISDPPYSSEDLSSIAHASTEVPALRLGGHADASLPRFHRSDGGVAAARSAGPSGGCLVEPPAGLDPRARHECWGLGGSRDLGGPRPGRPARITGQGLLLSVRRAQEAVLGFLRVHPEGPRAQCRPGRD